MRLPVTPPVAAVICTALVCCAGAAEPAIEFNRDIRPILADHCFQCHGPDAGQRQAELRLDTPEGADPERAGGPVVIAGQPEKSELVRRITSSDPDERMPPPEKGRRLNDAEVAALRQWIAEGAKWQKHWSLLTVQRPVLPHIRDLKTARGPLDTFILARLEKEGLTPSPQAGRATLLRRVTLALTGLPPAPDEVEAFLADDAPDAYERVVDRLLASPRYGERMAVPWLDAARYADTSGYQSDGERFMWRWRDWVIEVLNANMPFDQFTIEQIAGDLLPRPTLAQRIATGFHRNHRGNAEGGIIPEEYAIEYVADRVETTAAVWLGLTLGCCRCHDHKYDPFTQRDFYRLFAFFNNVPEKGRAIKFGNSPPYIQAPTRQQAEELTRLSRRFDRAEAAFAALEGLIERELADWEERQRAAGHVDWYPTENLAAHLSLDSAATESAEVTCRCVPGILGEAAEFAGGQTIIAGDLADFGFYDKFTLAAWVHVPEGGGGTVVSRMADVPEGDGIQLALVGGKLQLNLVKRWLDDSLRVESTAAITPGVWHHVAATYDGSRVADGVQLYVDGRPQKLIVLLDELNQSFATKEPLRIGGGGGPAMRFRGAIDEVRIYRDALAAGDVQILGTPLSISEIVATSPAERTAAQRLKLRTCFLEEHAPPHIQAAYREWKRAQRELAVFHESLPTVMVMEEMPTPRETHILIRGQYDKPGERVTPGVPAELPPLRVGGQESGVRRQGTGDWGLETGQPNRLDLAHWLVDPANPLTSRVIVNRVWQLHFGTGLVKTAEDFGRQGEWPSHPELLDWLAAELEEAGDRGQEAGDRGRHRERWDLKRLHRIMVTSATFRQSSAVSPAMLAKDPDNRLLTRAPRLRLPAEMVRDQALFASGLLVEQLGGPSVRPYQPPGLWSELTGGDDYQPGEGAELVRRSLYTFWKRTIPPPTLATFDAPTREFCSVRDSRTNTPLQALALLNEQTYVTAARALAERVIQEAADPGERIGRAMLLVLGRRPTEQEQSILGAALERYRQRYDEPAAYALVCSTILNLDEAVTRQ